MTLAGTEKSTTTSTGTCFIQIQSAQIVPVNDNGIIQLENDLNSDGTIAANAGSEDAPSDRIVCSFRNGASSKKHALSTKPSQKKSARSRTDSAVHLQKRLEDASESSKKLRFRITMLTTILGMIIMGISLSGALLLPSISGFFWGLMVVGGATFGLALIANDIVLVRLIACFAAYLFLALGVWFVIAGFNKWFVLRHESIEFDDETIPKCSVDVPEFGCAFNSIDSVLAGFDCLAVGYYIRTTLIRVPGVKFYDGSKMKGFKFNDGAFAKTSRQCLNLIWEYYRWYCGIDGVRVLVVMALLIAFPDRSPWWNFSKIPSSLGDACGKLLVAFLIAPQRHNVIGVLAAMTTKTETREAATIAALLGKCNAADGLAIAKEKFRVISFEDLKQDDFTTNIESAAQTNVLFSKTSQCELGTCDAFLSHSWKDNGTNKFAALSEWAKNFNDQEGRYPTLWLDKACIDQQDISNDLLCLPIFLAGCKHLLIIAGRTYAQRLWCIMEVFVFLKMGGSLQRVTILRIEAGDEDDHRHDYDELDMFDKVDVRKCACSLETDRQRLLGIIEHGFGEFDDFNDIVQQVFKERVVNRKEMTENEKRLQRELKDVRKQFQAV